MRCDERRVEERSRSRRNRFVALHYNALHCTNWLPNKFTTRSTSTSTYLVKTGSASALHASENKPKIQNENECVYDTICQFREHIKTELARKTRRRAIGNCGVVSSSLLVSSRLPNAGLDAKSASDAGDERRRREQNSAEAIAKLIRKVQYLEHTEQWRRNVRVNVMCSNVNVM